MKTLTLTQPWASLVALRHKKIETRSWRTPHAGPLAIHAAKSFPAWSRDFGEAASVRALVGADYEYPLGKVLCIVNLMGCRFTQDVREQLTPQELSFGDYDDGRYAWFLEFMEEVKGHPSATGRLGLWDWEQ